MFLKRLSPRTLFSSPSPYSIYSIAQFPTSSPSHLTYPHSHSHPDSRNVEVNCKPSKNVFRGAQAITAAIKSSGIKGPIQSTAFGDMVRLSRTNQEAFYSSGIELTHIPPEIERAAFVPDDQPGEVLESPYIRPYELLVRAKELEKEIDELNSKEVEKALTSELENLQKISEELESQIREKERAIRENERALKVAEESCIQCAVCFRKK